MEPVKNSLRNNYTDGEFHTHVSLMKPRGKYQFNRAEREKFMDAYCDAIANEDDLPLGVAEKAQNFLPVLVDADIKVLDDGSGDIDPNVYTQDQLKTVVGMYQKVLENIVDDCTPQDLTCVVLEKDPKSLTRGDNTYRKRGFHLHFPYAFLSKRDQEVHVIPRVKDLLNEEKTFENLGYENSSDVIDDACCSVPWLLYGSKKSDNSQSYKVTQIFDKEMRDIDMEVAFRGYELFDARERLINIQGNVEQYLPRILSIIPYGRSTKEIRSTVISPLKEKLKSEQKKKKNNKTEHEILSTEENLKIARRLLPMLGDFRVEEFSEWMTVGWALYNISDGDPEGLELWCDFSSRSDEKYDEDACIHAWERMTKRELTLGTLRYYASIDSPEKYREFKKERAKVHIKNSIDGSHNDIARVLHEEYGDEYVCVSVTNRVWFQFKNHIWEQIEDGVYLRRKITDLQYRYLDMVKELYNDLQNANDKSETLPIQQKIKQVNKIIANLKSAPFKNNVMKEAVEVFYDSRFRDRLDANPYLIAMANGVYDLKRHSFRPGRPEDFLSKKMPINYVNFNQNDEKVLAIHKFFEQIFPDKDIRRYFLDRYCEIFVGGNHEKTVQFWTGKGDNGKSVVQTFFNKMLGPFAIKFNTTIVTGKKPAAGAANADLARAGGGVRMATLEEPDGDEEVNVGVLKHLSGNDTFYARDLFEKGKDGREITPMFKLTFICLDEDTKITLPQGHAYSIKNLERNKSLLSWNPTPEDSYRQHIATEQLNFLSKGVHECVKITLKDGRTVTCTPNHKFLQNDNGETSWVAAKDVVIGETKLVTTSRGFDCDDILTQEMDDRSLAEMRTFTVFNVSRRFTPNNEIDLKAITTDLDSLCEPYEIVGKTIVLTRNLEKPNSDTKQYEALLKFSETLSEDRLRLREFLATFLPYAGKRNGETEFEEKCRKDIYKLYKKFDESFEFNGSNSDWTTSNSVWAKYMKLIGVRYCHDLLLELGCRVDWTEYNSNNPSSNLICSEFFDETLGPGDFQSMRVTGKVNVGERPVYDLVVTEPYSNFIANGIVSHNCNKLPVLKHSDKATWNRVKVIPFEATFCRPDDPAPESYEEQLKQKRFPMDPFFASKIPALVEPFAWMLLEHRKKAKVKSEPPAVRGETEKYQKQNDMFRQFAEENIKEDDGKCVTLKDLYFAFKEWFRESLPGRTLPIKNVVEEYFNAVWGPTQPGKKWKGHRLRTEQDDVEDGNMVIIGQDDLVDYGDNPVPM